MTTGREIARRGGGTAARPAAGGVAVRDSRTHGGSTDNIELIKSALRLVELKQQQVSSDMLHAELDGDARAEIEEWLKEGIALRKFITNGFALIDQGLDPLIQAYDAIGGPRQGGSPGFHSDV